MTGERRLLLECTTCPRKQWVEESDMVAGVPVRDWWVDVAGRRCKECRDATAPIDTASATLELQSPSAPGIKLGFGAHSTSVIAAAVVLPKSGTQRSKVLYAVAESEDGMTDAEIALDLSMEGNSVRPRRLELIEMGWLVDSGRRRASAGHGEGIVWVLAPGVTVPAR